MKTSFLKCARASDLTLWKAHCYSTSNDNLWYVQITTWFCGTLRHHWSCFWCAGNYNLDAWVQINMRIFIVKSDKYDNYYSSIWFNSHVTYNLILEVNTTCADYKPNSLHCVQDQRAYNTLLSSGWVEPIIHCYLAAEESLSYSNVLTYCVKKSTDNTPLFEI